MSLLLVIPAVWVALVALTIALLRMAALADADAERQARQEVARMPTLSIIPGGGGADGLLADSSPLEREAGQARRRGSAVAGAEVAVLLAALEARDGYTADHSHAVVELAVAVAGELSTADVQLEDVERTALLHDIGKIGISDAVLRKPAPLDEAEWLEMRRHPAVGARIVGSTAGLAYLARLIRAEHERWDGCGYPDGLWGEAIPLASRIVFACDAYHAMTSNRPYRRALPGGVAAAELRRGAGTQFCPRTVGALLAVLEDPERRFAGAPSEAS
jgi:HD-GYP domain-containing protein (c-di-GMP phosphodiesterase class II)